jgi:hypothetical protein
MFLSAAASFLCRSLWLSRISAAQAIIIAPGHRSQPNQQTLENPQPTHPAALYPEATASLPRPKSPAHHHTSPCAAAPLPSLQKSSSQLSVASVVFNMLHLSLSLYCEEKWKRKKKMKRKK